ncbi:uncharacterized protein HMPREF1120_00813 [Exophiala dermatitidis NIH/UT8656]|uniref:Uncharacterized protein n=1 Tax=Exophiala dermatitidis (strain ATCC 34100 / CBS 525.76 / NIH/UT8656) TaxID=858893 RepID=H6BKG8_EXODN|nr:uncharacterized protein HMPREF1120_00813 [Exophiala dermatitidis NIH/UT8656]EHY52602.1 hypothetical protein HMPREF1120_00813 [Exophiala dermatitidis NIH/UT8656]
MVGCRSLEFLLRVPVTQHTVVSSSSTRSCSIMHGFPGEVVAAAIEKIKPGSLSFFHIVLLICGKEGGGISLSGPPRPVQSNTDTSPLSLLRCSPAVSNAIMAKEKDHDECHYCFHTASVTPVRVPDATVPLLPVSKHYSTCNKCG